MFNGKRIATMVLAISGVGLPGSITVDRQEHHSTLLTIIEVQRHEHVGQLSPVPM
jgi:hypothetical protein